MYESILIICADCQGQFAFTTGEQEFFKTKGFVNQPKRCRVCRNLRRVRYALGPAPVETQVKCHDCGALTVVPFVPTTGRPVYCKPCYINDRAAAAVSAA